MHSKPLVSVIIPCYNVASYVSKALISILNQTYSYLEIIVIDDASSDHTLSILKEFKDSRIRLIALKSNTRKIGAVNNALSLSTGDLIVFQDSDDWSDKTKIEKQVEEFLKDEKLGICFTNYSYTSERPYSRQIALTDFELKDEFLCFGNKKFSELEPTMCATMMFRKEVLQYCSGYHPYFTGKVAEDIYLVYCILKRFKGKALREPLYNINLRADSLTYNQLAGNNAKAAYMWTLLSKIIAQKEQYNINILEPEHYSLLRDIELESCEEALMNQIQQLNRVKHAYEQSASFRIGKAVLAPLRLLKILK